MLAGTEIGLTRPFSGPARFGLAWYHSHTGSGYGFISTSQATAKEDNRDEWKALEIPRPRKLAMGTLGWRHRSPASSETRGLGQDS